MVYVQSEVSCKMEFQSSPALTGGCYGLGHVALAATLNVSILTRPYGRMLWVYDRDETPEEKVSILTRPYGRML